MASVCHLTTIFHLPTIIIKSLNSSKRKKLTESSNTESGRGVFFFFFFFCRIIFNCEKKYCKKNDSWDKMKKKSEAKSHSAKCNFYEIIIHSPMMPTHVVELFCLRTAKSVTAAAAAAANSSTNIVFINTIRCIAVCPLPIELFPCSSIREFYDRLTSHSLRCVIHISMLLSSRCHKIQHSTIEKRT